MIDQYNPLEESLKTMRDLPVFGDENAAIDFRHPKPEDLRSMPKEKQIQAIELKWQVEPHSISAIQVIYSNGCTSPVFLGRGIDAEDLKSTNLNSQ